jgi:hypothetical protein
MRNSAEEVVALFYLETTRLGKLNSGSATDSPAAALNVRTGP